MWEMLFAERLFGETLDPFESSSIRLMIRYLGTPPKRFLDRCKKAGTFFGEDGSYLFDWIFFENMADVSKGNGNTES